MRVPDVQQHVVPPRLGAASIPASIRPSASRHIDEIVGCISHHDVLCFREKANSE